MYATLAPALSRRHATLVSGMMGNLTQLSNRLETALY